LWDKDANGLARHQWQDASGDYGWANYTANGARYACEIYDFGARADGTILEVRTFDDGSGATKVAFLHYEGSTAIGDLFIAGPGSVLVGVHPDWYANWNTSGISDNDWMIYESVPWDVTDALDSEWNSISTQSYQAANWEIVNDTLPFIPDSLSSNYLGWNDNWVYWPA
jgi:hypothetical protein